MASPGRSPRPARPAALIRRIRQEQVPAIFAEDQFNPEAMEMLGKEARVKVVTNLYDDSLSSGPEANTYIAMMQHDVMEIVDALK